MTSSLCVMYQLAIVFILPSVVTSYYEDEYSNVCFADHYWNLVLDKAYENLPGGYYDGFTPIDSEDFYYDDEYWEGDEDTKYVTKADMMGGLKSLAESIAKLGEQLSSMTKSMNSMSKVVNTANPPQPSDH